MLCPFNATLAFTGATTEPKRLRTQNLAAESKRDDNELLAYRKQMKEMEDKIRLQEEEMEEMKRVAAEELSRKLAEGEVSTTYRRMTSLGLMLYF